jgi:hypothetical protein
MLVESVYPSRVLPSNSQWGKPNAMLKHRVNLTVTQVRPSTSQGGRRLRYKRNCASDNQT